ncbi:MAG: hypothetical protein CMI95_02285 [Pelagibacteraceae bacterium]|nr:hypothetical protein [Pelagibacteraceae bacterium]|tara:strand:+ start:13715 stop:14227 length:513 start_codon:yes stop_codon:yes gene_type:complete
MKYFFFILILLISNNLYSQNFATLNYEEVYSDSRAFQKYLNDIENFKTKQMNIIKKLEKNLIKERNNLDESKLIISEENYNIKINDYENNLQDYYEEIDKINNVIFNKIERGKSEISKEINLILQEIAIEDDILMIFDENNFVIAVKEIDITSKVIDKLNSRIKKLNIEE